MQFTTLSLALLAGIATASQPGHYYPKRVSNSTVTATPTSQDAAGQTTLTVYATSIRTITSCAASITNCPARATSSASGAATPAVIVVTDIITLATTICPITEAESASKAITSLHLSSALASLSSKIEHAASSGHFYGATTTPASSHAVPTPGASSPASSPASSGTTSLLGLQTSSVPQGAAGPSGYLPVPQGAAGPSGYLPVPQGAAGPSGSLPGPAVQTITGPASSHTLTYTLGTGSSTTVVTTTIIESSVSTIYMTVVPTHTVPAAPSKGSDSGSGSPSAPSEADVPSDGKPITAHTTTIYGTSTSTHYVTVSVVAPGSGSAATSLSGLVPAIESAPAKPSGNTGSGSSGSETCACGDIKTVTVTAAAQTVTVAAPTVTVTATAAISDIKTTVVSTSQAGAAATSDASVSMSTATVIPIPATTASVSSAPIYSNGTVVTSTKKRKCASSGFLTSKAGAMPTGS